MIAQTQAFKFNGTTGGPLLGTEPAPVLANRFVEVEEWGGFFTTDGTNRELLWLLRRKLCIDHG